MNMTHSFPQSWYPICLSSDIKRGALKPLELFGSQWILFRGKDKSLGVVSRFCPHMGTDLANGTVTDGCIACPLHNWQFDAAGQCTKMPKSNIQPSQVHISRLVTKELYGIVFVYWGDKVSFELPTFTDIDNPAISSPLVKKLDNPYLAVSLNGFDIWHFYHVHNRKITHGYKTYSNNTYHAGIQLETNTMLVSWYDYIIKFLGLTKSQIQLDYYGGNLIMVHSYKTGHTAFLALLPNETNETCTLFFTVALPKAHGSLLSQLLEKPKLYFLRFMSFGFIKPDIPIQKNMRPIRGMLTSEDAGAAFFWDYWEKLPRYPRTNIT